MCVFVWMWKYMYYILNVYNMYVIVINEKVVMSLKKSKEKYMRRYEWIKEKVEWCNYINILKIKCIIIYVMYLLDLIGLKNEGNDNWWVVKGMGKLLFKFICY